jgi:hypothetical protein
MTLIQNRTRGRPDFFVPGCPVIRNEIILLYEEFPNEKYPWGKSYNLYECFILSWETRKTGLISE